MASQQQKQSDVTDIENPVGSGPQYDYPTTGNDEPIPVVSPSEPLEDGGGGPPVPGEDLPSLSDKDIQRLETIEQRESGVRSEDMAENKRRPGVVEDPEVKERLPSDRG